MLEFCFTSDILFKVIRSFMCDIKYVEENTMFEMTYWFNIILQLWGFGVLGFWGFGVLQWC